MRRLRISSCARGRPWRRSRSANDREPIHVGGRSSDGTIRHSGGVCSGIGRGFRSPAAVSEDTGDGARCLAGSRPCAGDPDEPRPVAAAVRRRVHGYRARHSSRASADSPGLRCYCRSPTTSTRTRRSRCCWASARRPRPADPISAILFGAPGHAASAATTLDGYPMTKRGEAGRALGASYMSALMGGLFGAALMGIALPIMRPIILYLGSPELLAMAVFGISMVSVLSGQHAAARAHRGLPRHDAGDDRHRSADRNAALDHGQPLSVGRRCRWCR